ncbi:MAG: hypothetical protein ACFE8G_14400 [Candidatus Hermodarchaeota archaeon]
MCELRYICVPFAFFKNVKPNVEKVPTDYLIPNSKLADNIE